MAAAKAIDDPEASSVVAELKALLHDSKTTSDIYSAWGWGYLADMNKVEYQAAKLSMRMRYLQGY